MKKHIVFILFIVFTLFITSCGGDGDSGVAYYPLTVGDIWNYEVTMTWEDPDTTMVITGDLRAKITDETQLDNGTDVFEQVVAWTLDGSSFVDTNYIEETDAAIISYDRKDGTDPFTLLELPIEDGNTWIVNTTTTAVVLGKQDVSVPAGEYDNCWEIAYIISDDTTYVYFAEDVGEVKEYGFQTVGDTTLTALIELEGATIQ